MLQTVAHAAQLKRADNNAFDWARARECAQIFKTLRPWYPRDFLCLFDSLALLEFLAAEEIFADWVFGVRAEPFEAHCWVQREQVALNDSIERVSTFVPIMRV
jgi:hypothetical protein